MRLGRRLRRLSSEAAVAPPLPLCSLRLFCRCCSLLLFAPLRVSHLLARIVGIGGGTGCGGLSLSRPSPPKSIFKARPASSLPLGVSPTPATPENSLSPSSTQGADAFGVGLLLHRPISERAPRTRRDANPVCNVRFTQPPRRFRRIEQFLSLSFFFFSRRPVRERTYCCLSLASVSEAFGRAAENSRTARTVEQLFRLVSRETVAKENGRKIKKKKKTRQFTDG